MAVMPALSRWNRRVGQTQGDGDQRQQLVLHDQRVFEDLREAPGAERPRLGIGAHEEVESEDDPEHGSRRYARGP